MNDKKNKHMTIEDRTEIQDCLYKKMAFKAIAALIEKDPTTVSKEIKLHAQNHTNSFVTTKEMDSAENGNDLHGPFDNVTDLMDALNK